MLDLVVLKQLPTVLRPEMGNWVRECGLQTSSQALAWQKGFLLSQVEDRKQAEEQAPTSLNIPKETKQVSSISMQKLQLSNQVLPHIKEFILKGSPISALDVERASVKAELLLHIKESTLGESHRQVLEWIEFVSRGTTAYVQNVERALGKILITLNIEKFTLGKTCISVQSVGRALVSTVASVYITVSTQKRNLAPA
ncbi:hypothetical protein EYD10_17457 [Varanus komodoensis]|nr:hypothetical protein EYD10_17457 [Varanus komodoensis]